MAMLSRQELDFIANKTRHSLKPPKPSC